MSILERLILEPWRRRRLERAADSNLAGRIVGDEDGERYFAEGHVSRDAMIEAAIAAEKEWQDRYYPDPPELEEEIRAGSVSHYWFLECEFHGDGGGHVVADGTPRAVPMTELAK